MNIEALKTFMESLPESYCPIFGVEPCTNWCVEEGSVYWIDEDNCVYSSELTEGLHQGENFTIANRDTDMGYWCASIFENSKQLSFEEFEEKYSDYM